MEAPQIKVVLVHNYITLYTTHALACAYIPQYTQIFSGLQLWLIIEHIDLPQMF